MRKFFYLLLALCVSAVAFVGCNPDDEGCDTEGWKGYVTPYYEMEWMPKLGTVIYPMNIKFGVEWVTYV